MTWTPGRTLQLAAVHVARGGRAILRGVDLAFEPGRRYVILGASGSGKSTLIRLLNRLDDPNSGTIRLGDRPLADLPVQEVRRGIAVVPQAPRPLPGTVADNLAYPFEARRLPRPDRPALEAALAEVGLDPAGLDRAAGPLSGGERQRLALAVALGMGPEVLVLDEPTAALDPASARAIAALLARRATADGLRTIVVTHDHALAPHLGDVGIRLEGGWVGDVGPIGKVLARPKGNG